MGGDLITAEDEHIPQRYPGGNAPILSTETRHATATVTQANIDDYTVDIELNVKPTTTQVKKAGPSFRRCQVYCSGGQTEAGVAWGKLRLPLKNSIVSVLFVPGRLDPIVFNCLLFPEAETLHGNVKAMIDKLHDPEDWVDVHPSGVEIIVRKDKTIEITQPSGAELILTAAGEVQVTAKSGQQVLVSAGGAMVGSARLNDQVKSTAVEDATFWTTWQGWWTAWKAGYITALTTLQGAGPAGIVAFCGTMLTLMGTMPASPSDLTGKITVASSTVEIE